MADNTLKYTEAMGLAALAEWADLPQEIQERLFERAVGDSGSEFRAELAKFLHAHHPRTAGEYQMPTENVPATAQPKA